MPENKFRFWKLIAQIIKLWVNLNSAIHKCSAVDPNAIIGEPSAVLSLAVVGCIGEFYNNLQSSCRWSI